MLTPVWQAPNLASLTTVRHGFFGRDGGVSEGVYARLNCGLGTSDKATAVQENRHRVQMALGVPTLVTAHQTHSTQACWLNEPPKQPPTADALLTTIPELAIGVLSADCVPVLLCNRTGDLIGAIHTGWRGAAHGLLANVIHAIGEKSINPDQLCAAIGPAISQPSYEVGEDMRTEFCQAQAKASPFFCKNPNGTYQFDLPGFVAYELKSLGVGSIMHHGLCTYQTPEQLFSYRYNAHRGESRYGRQISALCLSTRKTIAQAA